MLDSPPCFPFADAYLMVLATHLLHSCQALELGTTQVLLLECCCL